MDQIFKFLKKLDVKKQKVIKEVLDKLYKKDFLGLDIKKLKGKNNTFRVRRGGIRIIYSYSSSELIHIIKIEFRNDNTY